MSDSFIRDLELRGVFDSYEDRFDKNCPIDCPVCGGQGESILAYIRKCKVCGTQYKTNGAKEESIPDFDYVRDLNEMMAKIINRRLSSLSRVVELGCAYGDLLNYLNSNGHIVLGLDMVDLKRKEYPFDVLVQNINDTKFPEKSLDAVIMVHVIEHLRYPTVCLEQIRPWLKDNGKIFIFTNEADNYPLGCIMDLQQQDTHKQIITEQGFRIMAERSRYDVKEFVHRWDYQIFTVLEKNNA